MPKLLIINKSTGTGGAAMAALRLFRAHKFWLKNWDVEFLAQEGKTTEAGVHIITKNKLSKYSNLFRLALEKLVFLPYEKSKELRFQFSLANTGRDISKNSLVENADILHLHWLYQGFLSLKGMDRLFSKGLPVVWTLHDMWTFTGGCHYTGDCDHFKIACGECPFLKNPSKDDLSAKIFKRKQILFSKYPDIVFVSCSAWLAKKARESNLLKNHRIEVIPNPIDTEIFSPGDKKAAREKLGISKDKFVLLFGAANVNDRRKGFSYLLKALEKMKDEFPADSAETELLVFGKASLQLPEGFHVYDMNLVSNERELVDIYRAADIFVLPSLEDNLPNTIMESLACGTPVVAFNSGGIPEMIDHMLNGFLAEYKNTDDLLKGILWVKSQPGEDLAKSARQKVLDNYEPEKISNAYKEIYLSLLNKNK
jgi:glycosyltransferase involved in cell wall biosynthesis